MSGRRRISWALPLLIFFGSATAAETTWQELMNQAEKLSDDGRWDQSVKTAENALADAEKRLGPEDPEVIHILPRLIRFYELVGDASQLPKMEKRLTAIKTKNFEAWFVLGKLLRLEEKPLKAEEALKNALSSKSEDPDAEYELALVYDDMGRFEDEAALLKKRIEKEPRNYPQYSQLASAYTRLGRFAEAKEAYAQAKKVDAASAYIDEGYFYLHAGHPVYAEKDFESAIAVDTSSPYGYHHMGSYLAQNRRYPEAEKYLRQALKKLEANPNTTDDDLLHTVQWLGDVIQAQGRSAEAEAVYRKGLEKARPGGDRQLWLLKSLAKLYVSQGRSAQAEESYKRAVAACAARFKCRLPYAAEAMLDLGRFYIDQGRKTEAAAAAEQAEKAYKNLPIGAEGLDVLRDLSFLYAKLGDVSKNEALYARLMPLRRAMPFNSDLVWMEAGMADLNETRGRFREAQKFYRQAIRIQDHNKRWKEEAELLDSLAAMNEKEGRLAAAEEARERAKTLRSRP